MTTQLSSELLEELKVTLEKKKIDLTRGLTLLSNEDSYADIDRTVGNSEDFDEASEDSRHIETQIKRKNIQDTLALVEVALAKIENGTYGICSVGKEPIDVARLRVFPEAENCLEHESVMEYKETEELPSLEGTEVEDLD